MKEIQGKCRFVVLPIFFDSGNHFNADRDGSFYLTAITEEQASELVGLSESRINNVRVYYDYDKEMCWLLTAKESLIYLLKMNGLFTKEMYYDVTSKNIYILDETGESSNGNVGIRWNKIKDLVCAIRIEELPDDLLIIKIKDNE